MMAFLSSLLSMLYVFFFSFMLMLPPHDACHATSFLLFSIFFLLHRWIIFSSFLLHFPSSSFSPSSLLRLSFHLLPSFPSSLFSFFRLPFYIEIACFSSEIDFIVGIHAAFLSSTY